MTQIISHRGINLSDKKQLQESTLKAFEKQLKNGLGIEFDINFTKDNQIIIFHDKTLERISDGTDKRKIKNLSYDDLNRIDYTSFCTLKELFILLKKYPKSFNAMHLKGEFQTKTYLDILLKQIKKNINLINNYIIFDVRISTARYLKGKLSELSLAASVSHEYDKKRFNKFTKNTLYTINQVLKNKDLFEWVWLDEWDRKDENGKIKTLYNKKTLRLFWENEIKIGLVTPELHKDIHSDTKTSTKFKKRLLQIKNLKPNIICTDYPNYI